MGVGTATPPEIPSQMTDTPEIPTFELTYEWPVVIILATVGG